MCFPENLEFLTPQQKSTPETNGSKNGLRAAAAGFFKGSRNRPRAERLARRAEKIFKGILGDVNMFQGVLDCLLLVFVCLCEQFGFVWVVFCAKVFSCVSQRI